MYTIKKRQLTLLLAATALASIVFGHESFAQSETAGALGETERILAPLIPAPLTLEIGAEGEVTLRGTVTEMTANTITLETWGGSWTVQMNSDTTAVSSSSTYTNFVSTSTPSSQRPVFSPGDFVGVLGTMYAALGEDERDALASAGDQESTVIASFVRNWSTDPVPELAGEFENPLATSTSERAEDDLPPGWTDNATTTARPAGFVGWRGVVNEIGEGYFIYTDDHGQTYRVRVESAAILDPDGEPSALDALSPGDSISLDGTVLGSFIEAAEVRFIS